MKSIKKTAIKNKKIILNTELNVPLSEDGEILDDARLVAGMETINYIMSKEPTILLLRLCLFSLLFITPLFLLTTIFIVF